jgi:hypothetical protein
MPAQHHGGNLSASGVLNLEADDIRKMRVDVEALGDPL